MHTKWQNLKNKIGLLRTLRWFDLFERNSNLFACCCWIITFNRFHLTWPIITAHNNRQFFSWLRLWIEFVWKQKLLLQFECQRKEISAKWADRNRNFSANFNMKLIFSIKCCRKRNSNKSKSILVWETQLTRHIYYCVCNV